jgi:hypothetical protein
MPGARCGGNNRLPHLPHSSDVNFVTFITAALDTQTRWDAVAVVSKRRHFFIA